MKNPSNYWLQCILGNNKHDVTFRACCFDDNEDQIVKRKYSLIEIKVIDEISFRIFQDSIINIQNIFHKLQQSLQKKYGTSTHYGNITFEISPIGLVLIENYWFQRVSKNQAIKIETKEGDEIYLYEDKALLQVKEITSSVREYLENLIISSYEKPIN